PMAKIARKTSAATANSTNSAWPTRRMIKACILQAFSIEAFTSAARGAAMKNPTVGASRGLCLPAKASSLRKDFRRQCCLIRPAHHLQPLAKRPAGDFEVKRNQADVVDRDLARLCQQLAALIVVHCPHGFAKDCVKLLVRVPTTIA